MRNPMETTPNKLSMSQSRPIMDLERSLARMGGDRSLLRDTAKFFLVDANELLAKLSTALKSKDAKVAARSAHSLAGLSANFGAEACSSIAEAIEDASEKQDLVTAGALMDSLQQEISRLIAALQLEFPN